MFNLGFDKRTLYIFLGIMLLINLVTGGISLEGFIFSLPGVIIAMTFHEFAHAWVATKLGDDTPRLQGRLNLNPLSHTDPVGLLCLLLVGFGWGKPVEINPRNFDRNISMEKAEAIVAVAGPIMNILLSIVLTVIYVAIIKFAPLFILTQVGSVVMLILQSAIVVNIGLGVFNLIPLPPLDGSKIFIQMMPYKAKQWIYENQRIFYIVFLVLWVTGLAGMIISPIISAIYSGITWCASAIFGLL